MFAFARLYVFIRIYANISVCTQVCWHGCMHKYVHVYACAHECMYLCIHTLVTVFIHPSLISYSDYRMSVRAGKTFNPGSAFTGPSQSNSPLPYCIYQKKYSPRRMSNVSRKRNHSKIRGLKLKTLETKNLLGLPAHFLTGGLPQLLKPCQGFENESLR